MAIILDSSVLLSALHHLFPPDHVETFARSDLKRLQEQDGLGSILAGTDAYGPTDPRSDLIATLNGVKTEALSSQQIRYLYQTIREKASRPFRTELGDL